MPTVFFDMSVGLPGVRFGSKNCLNAIIVIDVAYLSLKSPHWLSVKIFPTLVSRLIFSKFIDKLASAHFSVRPLLCFYLTSNEIHGILSNRGLISPWRGSFFFFVNRPMFILANPSRKVCLYMVFRHNINLLMAPVFLQIVDPDLF